MASKESASVKKSEGRTYRPKATSETADAAVPVEKVEVKKPQNQPNPVKPKQSKVNKPVVASQKPVSPAAKLSVAASQAKNNRNVSKRTTKSPAKRSQLPKPKTTRIRKVPFSLQTLAVTLPIDENKCDECGYEFRYNFPRADHTCKFYGYFKCTNCSSRWQSAHAWKGKYQSCKKCNTNNYADRTEKLKRSGEKAPDNHKPHPEHLCQRCRELGKPCYAKRVPVTDNLY